MCLDSYLKHMAIYGYFKRIFFANLNVPDI